MIPILYEKTETDFTGKGLCRLRDCISATVTEERNGIYECDFEYPVDGENYDLIQIGRIIGVSHDIAEEPKIIRTRGALTDEETDILTDENDIALTASRDKTVYEYDIQPFDIVSLTRPIDGVVTFHCVHISYRQSYLTVTGKNINSIDDAFFLFENAQPENPFFYYSDKESSGYLACADGIPRSVRSMLGGVEGSMLDVYGGEFEWDKWEVKLHDERGKERDFFIRYGVNMLDYNEEFDSSGTYSSCIPYWTDGTKIVVGSKQNSGTPTITERDECVPLDVSDKFESQPSKAQVEAMGRSVMSASKPMIPTQNIHVEFVRLQEMGLEGLENLFGCKLCDTINVVFPFYNSVEKFKIVKTVWNVLADRYDSMELGDLSVTLAEALGVSNSSGENSGNTTVDTITSFSSGWAIYDTADGSTVTLRRHGKVVTLTGALKNTSAVTLDNTGVTVFTIPEGYRPSQTLSVIEQGSGTNIYLARFRSNGNVTFERYRNSTSYSSISAGAWFPFHATWIMD